jgi:hypothetical protein
MRALADVGDTVARSGGGHVKRVLASVLLGFAIVVTACGGGKR